MNKTHELHGEKASVHDADFQSIYAGKRILVTGAGGSIGSRLVMSLLHLAPDQIAALDRDENAIYELEQNIHTSRSSVHFESHIADVRDSGRLADICKSFSPQVIFHAAAYKHVPLMELHPFEAVLGNVVGTENLLNIVAGFGAERFIFISTDKAVNPVSVMGATKRIGEMLVQSAAKLGRMRAACVRLGNVFGSRGSVIPLFQRQIAAGGPVTVTHPDIVRYFISMPRAVHQILRAGTEARVGEIYVAEMGQPRNIHELARELILLSGSEPEKDIAIQIIGLRPGEKLREELNSRYERLAKTRFEGLSVIEPPDIDERALMNQIARLVQSARSADRDAVYRNFSEMGLGFKYIPRLLQTSEPRHDLVAEVGPTERPKQLLNSANAATATAAVAARR